MAPPMRSSSHEAGHRGARVADPTEADPSEHHPAAHPPPPPLTTTNHQQQQQPAAANFEYDDNEWDIGIGDLIIDLDADIEKTTEVVNMATNAGPGGPQASKAQATAKMHIEHSATTADKGLKMKIKRTKPGTKTSEAKHEIVKSNELTNGIAALDPTDPKAGPQAPGGVAKPASPPNAAANKPRSSGHRRDKTRDKHSSSSAPLADKPLPKAGPVATPTSVASVSEMRATAPGPPRTGAGPGPPAGQGQGAGPSPGPPQSPAAATAQGSAAKPEQAKGAGPAGEAPAIGGAGGVVGEDRGTSPPPAKKLKTDGKEVADVCVGTSVGTITEPDCLGPCEPGTSVTLEGIVWHETEGGVLVVNVTWRGKTYVGTLLDCTRHDWAPPRFCDSPTSDLDNRTPKGRGKRGRSSAAHLPTPSIDVSTINFTETRSTAHGKLRNVGGAIGGGAKGARNKGAAPSSPAPPFPPPRPEATNKRKSRAGEEAAAEREQASQAHTVKKSKTTTSSSSSSSSTSSQTPCGSSPPPSPVLLECPEPNCSKKYKHINGLKYHQSHAHGSPDDDNDDGNTGEASFSSKDVVSSTSENDESNVEAASPPGVGVKGRESPAATVAVVAAAVAKKEPTTDLPLLLRGSALPEEPATPSSTPPSPATPHGPAAPDKAAEVATTPTVAETKGVGGGGGVVKPGVLRFSAPPEEYPVGMFSGNKPQVQGTPLSSTGPLSANRPTPVAIPPPVDQTPLQPPESVPPQPQSFANQLQSQGSMQSQQFSQPPSIVIPGQNGAPLGASMQQQQPQLSPHSPPHPPGKITQFKVKPASALMPDDKKQQQQQLQQQQSLNVNNSGNKTANFNKKKNRKSPAGSPDPPQTEQLLFGSDQSGRDEVQSPAYSDISDDGAPALDTEITDKNKNADKKTETGQALPHMPQYGMYHPFYSQQQYIMPSVQDNKPKEPEKQPEKIVEKEGKKDTHDYPQKVVQQHYYPYGYMPGYPYNMESNYAGVPLVQEDKPKEDRTKESPSPIDQSVGKQPQPIPNPIQVPTPGKVKEAKHQNDNHQILKESIEMKNQMSSYLYSRPPPPQQQQVQQQQQQVQQQQQMPPMQQVQQQQQQQQQSHHAQREEDVRRFYVYSEQRRKEQQQQQQQQQQQSMADHKPPITKTPHSHSPSLKPPKDVKMEADKKEKEPKQEGVKPTMETQGPPPPPTSQYAYIHPGYMQQAHYGALPFDPNHPMYRGIMVPGPYSGSPYIHAPIQRYHAPEDLSRAQPPPTKALDMLQHHAQYYSSHKIHELQERAIKSPTPNSNKSNSSLAASSPSANQGGGAGVGVVGVGGNVGAPPPSGPPSAQMSANPNAGSQAANNAPAAGGKQAGGDGGGGGKEARSPPPQRHVHTHHHTHVGLGYPMYPAPYGATVLASQQAAAVTVINPYPTK
ncbi:unnamed protein product [Phaedon cochleariae]|uniref:C2H2-type domain-containing protein n=1 Tax=Phaedon cochleariae TaxID=80249 RepID=A0A9P0DQQ5_PHACE|nr:unnamed protein product [Phaedon cochleariae]